MFVLVINCMKNRYLYLMLFGLFVVEELLILKINWFDFDFLVEDGMVVFDGFLYGILMILLFLFKI